jgi:hypothetical protein
VDLVLSDRATGESVAGELTRHEQGSDVLLEFTPTGGLSARSEYDIVATQPWSVEPEVIASFQTGDSVDETAPTGGAVEETDFTRPDRAFGAMSSCGPGGWSLELFPSARVDDSDTLFEVVVAYEEDFSDARSFLFLDEAQSFSVGHGVCWSNMPELDGGDRLFVKSRAVDLAGNVGPWHISEGSARVGGCSTLAASTLGSFLCVLPALAIRRRRS